MASRWCNNACVIRNSDGTINRNRAFGRESESYRENRAQKLDSFFYINSKYILLHNMSTIAYLNNYGELAAVLCENSLKYTIAFLFGNFNLRINKRISVNTNIKKKKLFKLSF